MEARALKVFKEYLESEYAAGKKNPIHSQAMPTLALENVHFWSAVEEFKKLPTLDVWKAKEIYKNFVADGAENEVNLSFEMKKSILDIFQSNDVSRITRNLFDHAQSTPYTGLLVKVHCNVSAHTRLNSIH